MNLFEKSNKETTNSHGFTLIELMITVAVVAILATIAIPSNLISRQRSEVAEALHMSDNIRQRITDDYNSSLSFPADNNEAGEPEPDLLMGNKVTRIEIENGAIHITLGNKANKSLQGKILTIRPAVVTGSPNSPISWLCGSDKPVPGMSAVGTNKTDLTDALVPSSCGS